MDHQLTVTHKRDGVSHGATKTSTGTSETNIVEAFAADAADVEIIAAIDVSVLKMLFIMATEDILLEWNDAAGAQGSITLKGNEPVLWHSDLDSGEFANPLGAVDVTSFFVTQQGAAAGTLYINTLTDATP